MTFLQELSDRHLGVRGCLDLLKACDWSVEGAVDHFFSSQRLREADAGGSKVGGGLSRRGAPPPRFSYKTTPDRWNGAPSAGSAQRRETTTLGSGRIVGGDGAGGEWSSSTSGTSTITTSWMDDSTKRLKDFFNTYKQGSAYLVNQRNQPHQQKDEEEKEESLLLPSSTTDEPAKKRNGTTRQISTPASYEPPLSKKLVKSPSSSSGGATRPTTSPPCPDKIGMPGISVLCKDLGIVEQDPRLLVIAYKCGCKEQGEITKHEFECGMKRINVDSLQGLKCQLSQLERELANVETLRPIYNFTFTFNVVKGKKHMPIDLAIAYWDLLLLRGAPGGTTNTCSTHSSPFHFTHLLQKWIEFILMENDKKITHNKKQIPSSSSVTLGATTSLRDVDHKHQRRISSPARVGGSTEHHVLGQSAEGHLPAPSASLEPGATRGGDSELINRDIWTLLFEFLVTSDDKLDNYDLDGAWPVLLDDFAVWYRQQNTMD